MNEPNPEALPPAKENVTSISQAKQQKMSKLDIKRHNQRVERRRRLINEGVAEDKVDQLMAKQDWEGQDPKVRLSRLESIVQQMFGGLAQDVMNLRRNDGAISDAFDMNYRAIFKMFMKLGVTAEDQKNLMMEVQAEVAAENQARVEATRKAQEAAQAQADAATEEAKISTELTDNKPVEADGAEAPEGATEFGT